tara:strand:- start:858 stop:1058 length:201 start_codon:yes stop_codon:yes gene_type:complete
MFNFNFENKQMLDQYHSTNALQEALLAQGILPMPNQLIPNQVSGSQINLIPASSAQYEYQDSQVLN